MYYGVTVTTLYENQFKILLITLTLLVTHMKHTIIREVVQVVEVEEVIEEVIEEVKERDRDDKCSVQLIKLNTLGKGVTNNGIVSNNMDRCVRNHIKVPLWNHKSRFAHVPV